VAAKFLATGSCELFAEMQQLNKKNIENEPT
jgi:hypothetical protein